MQVRVNPPSRTVAHRRGQHGLWRHVIVLLGYLLLTVVMTWPLAAQFGAAIPGDSFDGWQNYWNLWWMKVALVERVQDPYTTDLLYYPTGVTLYFHTLNPFNGLVTMPVQLVAGLIAAYNSVVLLSWVLAGYGMWLLARWVTGRASGRAADLAAFVAGAIFTFAPVHMAHLLGHMQVMALQWLPFYVLALLRGMARARAGKAWLHDGLLAGIFLTLAGLCDWYFVLYLFLFTTVVVIWELVRGLLLSQGRGLHVFVRSLAPAALAGILFALLLAPLLAPMVYEATQFSFMVRPSSDLYTFSATVLDFVLPNRMHTLFRPEGFGEVGNQVAPMSERTIGIGYAALALALLVLVRVRGQTVKWGVIALFFLLLALGPRMHALNIRWEDIPTSPDVAREWSLYAFVNSAVPFMRISRSVSRFAIMVQLAVAVLACVGLARWLRHLRGNLANVVGLGVLLLILAESWVAPYPMSPRDTPAYYETLTGQPSSGALLNLPMNYDRPGYLLYQTVHGRPLTVAYISRDDPRTLTERVPFLQHLRHLGPDILADDPAQVGMTVLHDLGVEKVVLDRYKMPGGEEREYTEAVVNALFAAVPPEYSDERITVYAVGVPSTPQPYLELGPLNWGALVESDGMAYRVVGAEAAQLWVRHAPLGSQIKIAYQSEGAALIRGADGQEWTLPAAPTGGTMTVELPAGVDHLTLAALAGEVQVHQLSLEFVNPR